MSVLIAVTPMVGGTPIAMGMPHIYGRSLCLFFRVLRLCLFVSLSQVLGFVHYFRV
jgi:hypothetical protein